MPGFEVAICDLKHHIEFPPSTENAEGQDARRYMFMKYRWCFQSSLWDLESLKSSPSEALGYWQMSLRDRFLRVSNSQSLLLKQKSLIVIGNLKS